MSLTDISLLIHFILEGIEAVGKFMTDERVRTQFNVMQSARGDDEKEVAAQAIASLLYNPK